MENSKVSALYNTELENYSRKQAAEQKGKWADTWEVAKSNFSKIVTINLLALMFIIPSVAVVVAMQLILANYGFIFPFNSNFGVSYPASPGSVGMAESLKMSFNLISNALIVLFGFISSVGISGGVYSTKKLLNTRGEFKIKDFFHGVKVSYFKVLVPVIIVLTAVLATGYLSDWAAYTIAMGNSAVWPTIAKIAAIIVTVLIGIVALWTIAIGASYKVGFGQILKIAFTFIFATPVHTIFFAAFAFAPVWLLLLFSSGFMSFIVIMVCAIFGLSFVFVVWMGFTQWVFDLFITPASKPKTVKKEGEKKQEPDKKESEKDIAMQLLAAGKSELIGKPILPVGKESLVAVPKNFKREDLLKAKLSKKEVDDKVTAYYELHKNDKAYAEYEKMFAEREKPVQEPTKKGKKKKRLSADNLLR